MLGSFLLSFFIIHSFLLLPPPLHLVEHPVALPALENLELDLFRLAPGLHNLPGSGHHSLPLIDNERAAERALD